MRALASIHRLGLARRSWLAVTLASCMALAACGGRSASTTQDSSATGGNSPPAAGGNAGSSGGGSSGNSSAGNSSAGNSSVSTPVACPLGLPSAEQIASTPRANTNLELLALKFSDGVVADQAIYDRIVRDVGLIKTTDSSVASIAYSTPNDGRTVVVDVGPDTFSRMQSNDYHAWDCLNQTYVVTQTTLTPTQGTLLPPSATLVLKGIYKMRTVFAQYSALEGVTSATSDVSGADGSSICLTLESDLWHYVFDEAGGDCLAGCTTHIYHHFTSNDAGDITPMGDLPAELVATYASRDACH